MDFQTWSAFVDRFIGALTSSVQVDGFYSYKIESNLATSEHYFKNISAQTVQHYLKKHQVHDPLFFKNHDDRQCEMLLLSQQQIPDQYQDFINEQQIGDNVELYFKYQQMPIRGISLIRSAQHGAYAAADLGTLERFYDLAEFYINQHHLVPAHIEMQHLQQFDLTKKEREVVQLVCQGMDNPHIAARLYISLSTVKTHIQHIFQKLDVQNKHQLLSKLMLLNRV